MITSSDNLSLLTTYKIRVSTGVKDSAGNTLNSQYETANGFTVDTVTAIATGSEHNCAVLSGGTVKCWGLGSLGQLGNGSTSNQSTPVSVVGFGG